MKSLLKVANVLVYIYVIVTIVGSVLGNLDIILVIASFGLVYLYVATVGIFVLYRKLKTEPLAFGPDVLSLGSHFSQTIRVLVAWNFALFFLLLILGAKFGNYDWITIGDLGRVCLVVFLFPLPALLTIRLQALFSRLQTEKGTTENVV